MFDVTFDVHSHPLQPMFRKVGRPRRTWLHETAREVFAKLALPAFDHRDMEAWNVLAARSTARLF